MFKIKSAICLTVVVTLLICINAAVFSQGNEQQTGTDAALTDAALNGIAQLGSVQIETPAKSAILMEFSTGTVVFEKDADTPYPPASITKLMTLYIGFEAIEKGLAKWDDEVYVSEKAWKTEGSRMFLDVNSKASYRDVITGISVVSGNDACVALAEHIYGSVNGFVKVMNDRATELGLVNSHFMNPHGLPEDGHHMSSSDIALLARALIEKYPEILKIESMKEFTYNNIHQYNRNNLLGAFPGADGLKTGWTEEAGYCLVATAKQKNMRYISVVLNTKDEEERVSASKELLSYAFRTFEIVNVRKPGDIAADIEVKKGKELSVPVKVDSKITLVVPSARKADIQVTPVLSANLLTAPVSEGTNVGTLEVRLDGNLLATSELSTAAEVKKAGFFTLLWRFIVNLFK